MAFRQIECNVTRIYNGALHLHTRHLHNVRHYDDDGLEILRLYRGFLPLLMRGQVSHCKGDYTAIENFFLFIRGHRPWKNRAVLTPLNSIYDFGIAFSHLQITRIYDVYEFLKYLFLLFILTFCAKKTLVR